MENLNKKQESKKKKIYRSGSRSLSRRIRAMRMSNPAYAGIALYPGMALTALPKVPQSADLQAVVCSDFSSVA
jgi:hypothetical protein